VGVKTIGIGHAIGENSPGIFKSLFGNTVDFDAVVSREADLTPAQVMTLFQHDLQEHMNRARRVIPSIDKYPAYVQAAIIDATYRGDLGPKTAGLIRDGKWKEAAGNTSTTRSTRTGSRSASVGSAPAWRQNAKQFIRYGDELTGTTSGASAAQSGR
jgi:GH24 family phage-related lysozyme (muramidase)